MSEVPLRPYDIGSDASTEGGPETPEEIPDFARYVMSLGSKPRARTT